MSYQAHQSTLTYLRSLEDTMKPGPELASVRNDWELVKNYADYSQSISSRSITQKVRTSTQPESLILAQSERWRQA